MQGWYFLGASVWNDSRFGTNSRNFLRYLAYFNKAAGLSEEVKICLAAGKVQPICIEYKLANKSAKPSTLRFFLAQLDTGKPENQTEEEDLEEVQEEPEEDDPWLQ